MKTYKIINPWQVALTGIFWFLTEIILLSIIFNVGLELSAPVALLTAIINMMLWIKIGEKNEM